MNPGSVVKAEVVTALLAYFADSQTVFEEYPAMGGAHTNRTLGRIWRAYKECREVLEREA